MLHKPVTEQLIHNQTNKSSQFTNVMRQGAETLDPDQCFHIKDACYKAENKSGIQITVYENTLYT